MSSPNHSLLPPPTAEQRRAAAGQFERANQVVATGNFDYGIGLLLTCCKLDPGNLIYRQALRRMPDTMDDQQPLPVPSACPVTLEEMLAPPPDEPTEGRAWRTLSGRSLRG